MLLVSFGSHDFVRGVSFQTLTNRTPACVFRICWALILSLSGVVRFTYGVPTWHFQQAMMTALRPAVRCAKLAAPVSCKTFDDDLLLEARTQSANWKKGRVLILPEICLCAHSKSLTRFLSGRIHRVWRNIPFWQFLMPNPLLLLWLLHRCNWASSCRGYASYVLMFSCTKPLVAATLLWNSRSWHFECTIPVLFSLFPKCT